MQIASLKNETGSEVLQTAYKFNVTFYDAYYLIKTKKYDKFLSPTT
jgi:hypothetical protein